MAILGCVVLLLLGSRALAQTGVRSVDFENVYKNVGVIMFSYQGAMEPVCSATLIHERIVLTAAHCTMYFASSPPPGLRTFVSFSKDNPRDPSTWIEITAHLIHPGFPWTNCVFSLPLGTGLCDVDGGGREPPVYRQGVIDVGLVVLASPVSGIPLAKLAGADDLAGALGIMMTFVGYGDCDSSWDGLRNFGSAPLQGISSNTVVYAGGPGIGCGGDSGGPTFYNDRVAAVYSDGGGPMMLPSFRSRVDTPVVLKWIAEGIDAVDSVVEAVEFYNAALDHYFITWVDAEVATLDAGVTIKGWTRTGQKFRAYSAARTGTSPVCRFYLPPAFGDSHFYGRGSVECNDTAAKNPGFVLEDPQFMHMILPTAGECPANTTPVFRAFDNRPDANHRYMVDPAIRDQMVGTGWIAEGDGPNLVVMCAPQ